MYPHILHICCTSTAIVSSPALLQVQLGQLDDVNAFAADAASCPSAACSVRTQLANYVSHQQKLFGALCTDVGSAYWRLMFWRACSP